MRRRHWAQVCWYLKRAARMVVDIGGGTTEVGVISLSGMVYKTARASVAINPTKRIVNYIRRNYGMLIGEPTAELIKKKSVWLSRARKWPRWKSKARNLAEGVPRSFTVNSNEILKPFPSRSTRLSPR